MHSRSFTWIIIQGRDAQNDMSLCGVLRKDMRAADGTEAKQFPRRRLKRRELLFALYPPKVLSHHSCRRDECGRIRFAATPTMAMCYRHIELIDLVFNRAA